MPDIQPQPMPALTRYLRRFSCLREESRYEVKRLEQGVLWCYHSGLLSFSVNEENMMLKLMLILSSSLMLASTECSR